MSNEEKLYEILEELKIKYKLYRHKEVCGIQDIDALNMHFEGQYCKNLFLRNSREDMHYLLILMDHKQADLKKLARSIGSTRLSFASEESLYSFLQLKPGSVTPFGLINDHTKQVAVLLDKDLEGLDKINFHPNTNRATLTLSYKDLMRFLDWCGNAVLSLEI